MQKKLVNEIFWLRSISCLAIVLIHAIETTVNFTTTHSSPGLLTLEILHLILLFATPTYVFISEFLLAKAYKDGVPSGFFLKRVKNLIIPYCFMGIVYAFFEMKVGFTWSNFAVETLKNIFMGDFVAWFILLIFQFYILHMILSRLLDRIPPLSALLFSFIVSVAYLGFFNLSQPIAIIPFHDYIWSRGYWIPCIGWLFYFTVGYYTGRNYDQIVHWIQRRKLWVIGSAILTLSLVFVLDDLLFSKTTSKRPDILIYTCCIIALIFFISKKIYQVPRWIYFISSYSFSIYLLHKLIMVWIPPIPQWGIIPHTAVLFVTSLICSIAIAYLLNHIPYGKYVVGVIQKVTSKKVTSSVKSKAVIET
jgi:membrane-bound acyltransferase YfiQ involved in biofilm formation